MKSKAGRSPSTEPTSLPPRTGTTTNGFLDEVDLPAALSSIDAGGPFIPLETSYFLSRQTVIASDLPGMALWREKLYAGMVRNTESAMEFFKLPTNRVDDLGSQLEI